MKLKVGMTETSTAGNLAQQLAVWMDFQLVVLKVENLVAKKAV